MIIVLAVTTAACSSNDSSSSERSSSSPTTTTAAAADPPEGGTAGRARPIPVAGDCLEPMTSDQARGTNLPEIVACDGPRGGEVIEVWQIPDASGDTYPVVNGELTNIDATTQRCVSEDRASGAFVEFAGDNRLDTDRAREAAGVTEAWRVSGVTAAVFVPGPAGWDRGERWLACAAVLDNAAVASRTTTSLRGAFATPGMLDTTFGWCKLQSGPQANRFDIVNCADAHTHEQLASFRVAATNSEYPGDEAVARQAEQVCPILAGQATGGRTDDLAEPLGLSWTYPVADDWASGDQIARCFITSATGTMTGSVGSDTVTTAS